MDYNDKNAAPVRRRAERTGEPSVKPADSTASARADGYSTRQSARGTAPVVRNAPRTSSASIDSGRARAASSDYHQRVRARAAANDSAKAGNAAPAPARVNVRPASGAARTGSTERTSASTTARPSTGAKRPAPNGTKRPANAPQRRTAPRSHGAGVRHKKNRNPKWASALLVVCAMALIGVGYVGVTEVNNYMDYQAKCRELEQDTFYDGITLEGESLSGLTMLDAIAKYQKQLSNVASATSITITARGKTYTLDSSSVQMSTNLQSTLSLAYSTGRTGSFDERYAQLQQLKSEGLDFSLNRGWNEDTLRSKISQIAADVYVKGQDADVESFDPDTGKFTFTSEVTGYELDSDDLYAQITQAVANGNVNANIEAKIIEVAPEHTVEYMKEHFGRISYAQTKTTSNSDRNRNIQLATAEFNGMRVEPGETVSFNKTTGERTEAKGYRAAGAYSGGVLVQEPGGGVCQVSTTLYNAAVKADLEIIERSPHSRVSDYVPIGLDAAVNWPSQDFKFKNTSDYPIFIVAEFADQKLTFKIYGKQLDDGVYIKLESEKTETIAAPEGVKEKDDPTLPVGQFKDEKARDGAKAVSYKVYYDKNDNEIKRELLAKSTYPASIAIHRVGTGT
ncbi:MAG: VanW family protein [Clostridiales bacterium]|nr:VanW family protein [Clostridiales bacterium]